MMIKNKTKKSDRATSTSSLVVWLGAAVGNRVHAREDNRARVFLRISWINGGGGRGGDGCCRWLEGGQPCRGTPFAHGT